MPTTKFVFYTDPHLKERNPSSRVGSYMEDIFKKLSRVGEVAKEEGAEYTVCGGDLLDDKIPRNNSYYLTNRIIDMLGSWGTINLGVEGNHDLRNDSLDTIDEQPIATVFRSGKLVHLRDMIIGNNDTPVRIQGYDFEEAPDLELLKLSKEDKAKAVNVLVMHIYASPKGGDLFGTKIYSYEEIAKTGHDVYLFGHFHRDQGIVDTEEFTGSRQIFVNIGSISRGSYGDESLNRTPKCCLVEIKDLADGPIIKYKTFDVEAKPAEEVFDMEAIARRKNQEAKAKELQVMLKNAMVEASTEDLDGYTNSESEDGLDLIKDTSPLVQKKVQEYLERAREELCRK